MNPIQKSLRLRASRIQGEAQWKTDQRERELNKPISHVSPEKQFADLLKRQARQAMRAVTECPPDTITAHLARLDDLREQIHFAIHHQLEETAEARPSGDQLTSPQTLADYLACIAITRRDHRAPGWLDRYHEDLQAVHHKLDLLAGLFSQSRAIHAIMENEAA